MDGGAPSIEQDLGEGTIVGNTFITLPRTGSNDPNYVPNVHLRQADCDPITQSVAYVDALRTGNTWPLTGMSAAGDPMTFAAIAPKVRTRSSVCRQDFLVESRALGI